jgi:hypothetical protein
MNNPPPNPEERSAWPMVNRLPNGWLELSFDAPLTTPARADWLKVRDWLAREFGATFHKSLGDPITMFWIVDFTAMVNGATAEASVYASDFPDDLCIRVRDQRSEPLIAEVANRLLEQHPDFGDLSSMDAKAFLHWFRSLGGSFRC